MFRSWVVGAAALFTGACGGGPAANGDAATQRDALAGSGDAPPLEHGIVKALSVDEYGAGIAGVTFVFTDSSGSQIVISGSDGIASADVEAGASVTQVAGDANAGFVSTVLGAKPGDTLNWGGGTDSSDDGTFTVDFQPVGSADQLSYLVYGPCSGGFMRYSKPPVVVDMQAYCKADVMDLIVVPVDENLNEAPIGYYEADNVPFVASGSATIPNTLHAFTSVHVDVTDIPAVTTFDVTLSRIYGPWNSAYFDSPGSAESVDISGPRRDGDQLGAQITGSGGAISSFSGPIDATTASFQLDVGSTALPFIAAPTLDAAAHTLHVAMNAQGTTSDAPDALYGEVTARRGTSETVNWIFTAASPGDLVLPVLPAPYDFLNLTTTDVVTYSAAIMWDQDNVTGYDGARAVPLFVTGAPGGQRGRTSSSPTYEVH